jgi:hypothetical protein
MRGHIMDMGNRQMDVDGRHFGVQMERRIVGGRRSVIATAYDPSGKAMAIQEMNTAAARGHLHRALETEAPTWEELEDIAVQMLRLQLEE